MLFQYVPFILIFTYFAISTSAGTSSHQVRCLENGQFYRDPDRPTQKLWTSAECSKYYLCVEGEVFNFKCSTGLLFDIRRQICDLKTSVDNCDVTSVSHISSTNLNKSICPSNQQACLHGLCLPKHYFCDGSVDCIDGSDEIHCNPKTDPNPATPCNASCSLPNCFCSHDGTQIPGNLLPSETPQMIILTFDGTINFENWELYDKFLFNHKWKNPNGCPIKATFFVNHQFNNYHQTQKLWNRGHEIGVHSITHRLPETWWANNATIENWFDEMVGQANILHKFSKIRLSEIRGLRVPFLQVGWNRQFLMMEEFGFVYDSSIVAPFSNPPIWPYTLDHKLPHDCENLKQNCPTRAYPGVWEMVMNQVEADGYSCAMVDSCPQGLTGDDIYRILVHNFRRHYLTNRAPFGLYFHSSWFKKPEYLEAFQDFVSEILKQPDVWFVTNSQAISWMQNPVPVDHLNSFKAWACNDFFNKNEIACNVPNVCKLYSNVLQQDRYLYTCFQCPKVYPWIRNEFGVE